MDNQVIEFIKNHSRCHFMQSPEWALVKNNWKNENIIVRDANNNIKGYMSILLRKVPIINKYIGYCPRGPIWDINDNDTFKELISKAKDVLKKNKCYVLRIDPDISIENKDFLKLLKELNFKVKNAGQSFEYIQPRFVMRTNIMGKDEDEVLMSFEQKTRYNIRLAIKKGVSVKIGNKSDLDEFQKIIEETSERNNILLRPKEYYQSMFDSFQSDDFRLYLSYYDNQLISGAITIRYGNKCWYLYGASSNKHRNVMGNYLLQWEMMKWAIQSGCEIYDFMGVSGDLSGKTHPTNLYRFKKGFGSDLNEFVGECDLILDKTAYLMAEEGIKLFLSFRSRIVTIKNIIFGK